MNKENFYSGNNYAPYQSMYYNPFLYYNPYYYLWNAPTRYPSYPWYLYFDNYTRYNPNIYRYY